MNEVTIQAITQSTTGIKSLKQLNFLSDIGNIENVSSETFDYRPAVFDQADCDRYLQVFLKDVRWSQTSTMMYDKQVLTPRLYAWFGDANTEYVNNGKVSRPAAWTPELLEIRSKVEALSGIQFNSVLLNYYRDEHDSVAWHSDRDHEPGKHSYVASVSFGEARSFDLRRKNDHRKQFSVLLQSGDYLLMKAEFQDQWEHRIAKSRLPMSARINLTFRIAKSV